MQQPVTPSTSSSSSVNPPRHVEDINIEKGEGSTLRPSPTSVSYTLEEPVVKVTASVTTVTSRSDVHVVMRGSSE